MPRVRTSAARKRTSRARARAKALALIEHNIASFGFHIYVVGQEPASRFAYTIGLRDSLGAELVLAGGRHVESTDDAVRLLHIIRNRLVRTAKAGQRPTWSAMFRVRGVGSFTLRRAHGSWTRALLLGALDYYGIATIAAYQIVPTAADRTLALHVRQVRHSA